MRDPLGRETLFAANNPAGIDVACDNPGCGGDAVIEVACNGPHCVENVIEVADNGAGGGIVGAVIDVDCDHPGCGGDARTDERPVKVG